MTDPRPAPEIARAVTLTALGRDPGPMVVAESSSHDVYAGADVVVKLIDADRHSRLDREIALVPSLPAGLTAPLLASGRYPLGTRGIRYACYARVPGAAPGLNLSGVDGATARQLTEQAVDRLSGLHAWRPAPQAGQVLKEPLDHGGFVSREALQDEIENLGALSQDGGLPRPLLEGLRAIAERAPTRARTVVPVHADCHWGNWLVRDQSVTALLDFEWARIGEPADDWFFLIRFSGPHANTVLDIVAGATAMSPETLRAQCEVREAAYLVSDLRLALASPGGRPRMAAERLRGLEELVTGRYWWRGTR